MKSSSDGLRADEAALEVAVDHACRLGAVSPMWMVHAHFLHARREVGLQASSLKAPRIRRARPGSVWPISARNMSRPSLISAISASILAQMATTGAFWLAA